MTNPNWLDEERRLLQIYTGAVHHACKCKWVRHHLPDDPAGTEVWLLQERARRCPIHGENGHS